jgi:hypothetical protein
MIVFEANYSKKLGLPGYSSHQYSVTIRTELADISQIETQSAKMHTLLQTSVDREIQKTGFLPEANGNGHSNGHYHSNGHAANTDAWDCSDPQKNFILDIIAEHKLDKTNIDRLAQDRFGKPVKKLNKLEASGLIDELLEMTGGSKGTRRYAGSFPKRGAR